MPGNQDLATVEGFSHEWVQFDQRPLSDDERESIFQQYFCIFPWKDLASTARGFDLGCGSGRWAQLVAPRAGELVCIDASAAALEVARTNLAVHANCRFMHASVDNIPLANGSMDFGYSLGVLHHVPDTEAGIRSCAQKLKAGAPFLIYLYYAFDNRPLWFSTLWRISDVVRRMLARLPFGLRLAASQLIALMVYWPTARLAKVLASLGADVSSLPLSFYKDRTFYVMRTDALDRFGTRLEQRFTQTQIRRMLERSGFERIKFSSESPYWCAVGYKRSS